MLTKTPFLTGFSNLLFGRAKASKQELLRRQRQHLHEDTLGEISGQFAEEIPPELVHSHASTSRNRVYSHEVTFWGFLAQVLSFDRSCACAVAQIQEWFRMHNLPMPSANTGSYVEARKRLPERMLQAIARHLFAQLERNCSEQHLWRGHRIKAVDGTSAQMPDTGGNQRKYPQPSTQAVGCGFPVIQLVGLIDLIHGGWQEFVESNLRLSEPRALDQLRGCLQSGDLLVGDRAYVSYEAVCCLMARGVHFVGRNHQSRKRDFRRGKKLGSNERLQVWRKPHWQPPGSGLTPEQWEELPEEITIRIIRTKGLGRDGKPTTRYIISTLLDAVSYPAEEVASLYVHRWEIELRFRDIKTTMGMDMLRTKSPAMIRKEVLMHMIAYNALRLLMLKSAAIHGCNHRRLSFKGALQALASTRSSFADAWNRPNRRDTERANLLEKIAERIVPERPGRNEPREVKRRPKSSRWLQIPRWLHPEHFRTESYPRKILDEAA